LRGVHDQVRVPRGLLDDVVAHARDVAPGECCGLLLGTAVRIAVAMRARNLSESRTRYLIDPADHFAAIRRARGMGLEVIGAYHSHPVTVARPSPTDCDEAHAGFLYVIVSLAGCDPRNERAVGRGVVLQEGKVVVRAWRLASGAVPIAAAQARPSPAAANLSLPASGNFVELGLVAEQEERGP
jgi:proteasome lid subunit RPN8/RPN11